MAANNGTNGTKSQADYALELVRAQAETEKAKAAYTRARLAVKECQDREKMIRAQMG